MICWYVADSYGVYNTDDQKNGRLLGVQNMSTSYATLHVGVKIEDFGHLLVQ